MPIVVVNMFKRDVKMKRAAAKAIAEVVADSLQTPLSGVHIVFNEMSKDQYAVAGTLYCDKATASARNPIRKGAKK